MDTHQALKTLRAVRQYTDRDIPDDILNGILQAARWTGSAKNVQPWKFVVVTDHGTLARLADCGTYAGHLRDAPLAIVVVTDASGRGAFDSGRVVQSMMLAAWSDGVGSCIASMHREAEAKQVLAIPKAMQLQQVVAFGYPQPGVVPTIQGKPLNTVLASTGRRPLADLVFRDRWGNA